MISYRQSDYDEFLETVKPEPVYFTWSEKGRVTWDLVDNKWRDINISEETTDEEQDLYDKWTDAYKEVFLTGDNDLYEAGTIEDFKRRLELGMQKARRRGKNPKMIDLTIHGNGTHIKATVEMNL